MVAQQGQLLQLHGMAWHGMAAPPALREVPSDHALQEVLTAKMPLRRCQLPIVGLLLLKHPLCPH